MKAELLPLDGKYYGSKIRVVDDDGNDSIIEVWHMGNYKPSQRELAEWGDGEFEACDSHFESRTGYEICERIVKALNE